MCTRSRVESRVLSRLLQQSLGHWAIPSALRRAEWLMRERKKEVRMFRKVGVLGAAVTIVLTMSAVASVASADVLTSESGSVTTLNGSNDEAFSLLSMDGLEMKCAATEYFGFFSSGASQIQLAFTQNGCSMFGLSFRIEPNGCEYLFRINAPGTTGTTDVVCPAGKEITFTWPATGAPKCIVHVPAQSNLGTVTATNVGSGSKREVTLTLNFSKLKFNQTTGTAETFNCMTGDNTIGSYTAKVLFTGRVSTVQVGIFLS